MLFPRSGLTTITIIGAASFVLTMPVPSFTDADESPKDVVAPTISKVHLPDPAFVTGITFVAGHKCQGQTKESKNVRIIDEDIQWSHWPNDYKEFEDSEEEMKAIPASFMIGISPTCTQSQFSVLNSETPYQYGANAIRVASGNSNPPLQGLHTPIRRAPMDIGGIGSAPGSSAAPSISVDWFKAKNDYMGSSCDWKTFLEKTEPGKELAKLPEHLQDHWHSYLKDSVTCDIKQLTD
ncbi:hypothetical protein DFH05DRAFT_1487048 [Lentinula detonsa]|uniref:Uncharacterized protein n=1 Tax=Lentinula detonsa TaxID=2804962 RepID=A0A9W8P4Q5_9AGAR|nr:hypothetical protein DFH05DRAFT_1487048 [Lentinula detonsa]